MFPDGQALEYFSDRKRGYRTILLWNNFYKIIQWRVHGIITALIAGVANGYRILKIK
jgi:hypothetical protein